MMLQLQRQQRKNNKGYSSHAPFVLYLYGIRVNCKEIFETADPEKGLRLS